VESRRLAQEPEIVLGPRQSEATRRTADEYSRPSALLLWVAGRLDAVTTPHRPTLTSLAVLLEDLARDVTQSQPTMSGCGPIGLGTIPGRQTKAARQPTARAPETSHPQLGLAATFSTCSVISPRWQTPGMPGPTARCGTHSSAC
jgi:hypothetical protein